MISSRLWMSVVLACFGLTGVSPAQAPDAKRSKGEELVQARVLPMLKAKCFGCHGGDPKLRGDLDLRSREAMLRGGRRGAAVVPGDSQGSLLVHAVRWEGGLKMPPKDEDRL